jgi:hypothetical protein
MKHYVYSARITEQGLALLNKARGGRGWDTFVNQAVATHYNLPLDFVSLPPSKYLIEREKKRKAKEAENTKKKKAAKKIAKEVE